MERINTIQTVKKKILDFLYKIWYNQEKRQRSKEVVFILNGVKWYYPDCDLVTLDEATTYENDSWRLPSIEEFTEMDNNVFSYDKRSNMLVMQADNVQVCFASYPYYNENGKIAQERTSTTHNRMPFWTNWRDSDSRYGAHCRFLLRCNGFKAYHGAHPRYNKAGLLLIEKERNNAYRIDRH